MCSSSGNPRGYGYREPPLWFLIDLPALTAIGKRFDWIVDAPWEGKPGIPWRDLVAAQEPTTAEDDEDSNSMPARANPRIGRFRIECGIRREAAAEQKEFFDWLTAHQEAVLEQIKPAVISLFDETFKWRGGGTPNAQFHSEMEVLFPADADDNEKLDRFRVSFLEIDPTARYLRIEMESLDGWYDEHGCSIVLRDGKVWCYGSWDDIAATYEAEQCNPF